MLNKSYKLLAVILALSVLFSCLPMSIFAFDVPNESESLPDVNEAEAYSSDVIVEDESLREENVKHFRMPDGSYTAVAYNNPVHRKDSNGNWQDIDNRMNESTVKNKQAFVTADGRTVFSKKINSDDSTVFELSENGYSIKVSFANADIKNTTAKLSNHATKYTPTSADDIETQYKKLKTIDNNTTVAYKNLLKGMTLEYVLSANDIKENIIVEKTNDSYAYTFIYELTGLTAVLNDDGSIVLLDETEQVPVYEIPAPYMYDANNATSDNVSYALSDLGNGTYELTVSADEAWINSSERAFPVVIDPSMTFEVDWGDTYISSSAPNTNYGESEKLWISPVQITFLQFGDVPRLAEHVTVNSATLNLRYYYYISTGSLTVGAYRVTNNWTEYALTWNTANTKTNMGISTDQQGIAVLPAASSIGSSTPGVATIDVTTLVQSWYAGVMNYGVALKYEGGSNTSVILNSRETYSGAYYEISYTPNSAPIENDIYILKNKQINGCVQIDDNASINETGAILELWDLDGGKDQRWNLTYLHNGYYKITSFSSAKAITAPLAENAPLTQEFYQANDNQMWQVISVGNGLYQIAPKSNPSYRMAVGEDIGVRKIEMRAQQLNNQDEWYLEFDNIASISLRLPNEDAQNKTNWCWAACSKMVGEHNGGDGALRDAPALLTIATNVHSFGEELFFGETSTGALTVDGGQREIVINVHGDDDNYGGSNIHKEKALQLASVNDMDIGTWGNGSLSTSDIAAMNNELAAGRWVIGNIFTNISWRGHSVVIKSYDTTTQTYTFWDPWTDNDYTFMRNDLLNDTIRTESDPSNRTLAWVQYCN